MKVKKLISTTSRNLKLIKITLLNKLGNPESLKDN